MNDFTSSTTEVLSLTTGTIQGNNKAAFRTGLVRASLKGRDIWAQWKHLWPLSIGTADTHTLIGKGWGSTLRPLSSPVSVAWPLHPFSLYSAMPSMCLVTSITCLWHTGTSCCHCLIWDYVSVSFPSSFFPLAEGKSSTRLPCQLVGLSVFTDKYINCCPSEDQSHSELKPCWCKCLPTI